ncbi:cobalamin biosynthesis protein [Streptomyces sp. NPDC005955]|uniref:cobalamin biosynthesis protein n=1 Tax=Streptomyces sp. NPDC005955 TaxID=3364738 RepID=UPI0036A9490D
MTWSRSPDGVGVVAGVGAARGVPCAEVLALVRRVLAEAGVPPAALVALATVDRRAEEPGVVGAARRLEVPLWGHPAADLARIVVPHPSDATLAAVGTPSVAEAAALFGGGDLLGGGELLVPKRKSVGADGRPARATCALARYGGDGGGPARGPGAHVTMAGAAPEPIGVGRERDDGGGRPPSAGGSTDVH